VGFVTVDFAAGGAGHGGDGVAVDDQPEAVGLGDDGEPTKITVKSASCARVLLASFG
jgi:hypothetical protein